MSNINSILALMFVGVFSVGAWLVIWDATYDVNPVADLMVGSVVSPAE